MKYLASFLLGLCIFFVGCKGENTVSSQAFSSGTDMQQETQEELQNIDKKSYAGLEHIFQDTSTIQTNDKFLMLVFGKNNCKYCDKMKQDIKESTKLQSAIKDNFSPYYINISYDKVHNFNLGKEQQVKIMTSQLANSIYKIQVTPTTIFGDKNGKTIIEIPGYVEEKDFIKILDFIDSRQWEAGKDTKERMKLLQEYLSKDKK